MAKDFKISRTEGLCRKCGGELLEGDQIVALVRTGAEELVREDYHAGCWDQPAEAALQNDPEVLGIWRTSIPRKEEKKKLLVDDGLLINFFERLAGQDEPSRLNFRYVLALILMRKKLLNYLGSDRTDGVDVWRMRFKGSEEVHEVIDPGMDEDKIAEASASLGEIMQGDFE
jgi:hypothetical protein